MIYPFKVYNSIFFGIFSVVHHHFHTPPPPKENPIPVAATPQFPLTLFLDTVNH